MSKNKRIALVCPFALLDSVPCLYSIIKLLAEKGYFIEIFILVYPDFPIPEFNHPNISIKCTGRSLRFLNWMARRSNFWRSAVRFSARILYRIQCFIVPLFKSVLCGKDYYSVVMAIDPEGLLSSKWFITNGRPALVYFSLEIWFREELDNRRRRSIKARELEISSKADLVVIQDAKRAELLVKENNLDPSRITLIPNAQCGKAEKASGSYWHKRFNLDSEKKVCLYAGSVMEWSGIGLVLDSLKDWSDEWVLVIHTRAHSREISKYQKKAGSYLGSKAFFSLDPVSRNNYEELVKGADVGLALYIPKKGSFLIGDNVEFVGLSSGKAAAYLQCGIPVITNSLCNYADYVKKHGFGEVVSDPSGVGPALAGISKDYDRYSDAAGAFFDEFLECEKNSAELFEFLDRRI